MIVQSDEDDSESNDNGMVLAAGKDTCQTGILAVNACIGKREIEDVIVDTGSTVSLVSPQFSDSITTQRQLQPIKSRFMVANGFLLNIKRSIELNVAFDKIEITRKFLCVDTNLSLALLGYDFLRKNKVDILNSANCLLIQNVPIIYSNAQKSQNS